MGGGINNNNNGAASLLTGMMHGFMNQMGMPGGPQANSSSNNAHDEQQQQQQQPADVEVLDGVCVCACVFVCCIDIYVQCGAFLYIFIPL
jgi:hypothetical protein